MNAAIANRCWLGVFVLVLALQAPMHAQEPPAKPGTMQRVLDDSEPSDWRALDPDNTLYVELAGGRVIIELAPDFAPAHVANIRQLARERYWDGLAILRSHDNYVVQWGDPEAGTPKAKSLGKARKQLPAEFTRDANGAAMLALSDHDGWALETGFAQGFAVARDREEGKAWLTHCYGSVGAGRDNAADSSNGTELYVVIGQSPRHLDRNITLVGRVIAGMELLSAIPRGTGALGFYEKPEQRVALRSIRLLADVPERDRTPIEVMRTDTATWNALIESRRNRRDDWYLRPAGHINVCNVPLPTRSPSTATSMERTKSDAPDVNTRFAEFSRRFLDGWLALVPVAATQLGDHRFDAELDDLSPAGNARVVAFARGMLAELDAIDIAQLSRDDQVDALIARNQLESDIWSIETLRAWSWDPQNYSQLAGSAIYNLMAREYAPLPQRLNAATARMQKLPGLFAQMRENLDVARVPKIHAETVAKQHSGVLSLVDQFLTPNASVLKGEERVRFDKAIANLRTAVAEHQKWLDDTLVPGARGDFRLGAALYDQKLKFALMSSLTRADIKQRAEKELTRVRSEMYAVARTVLTDKPNAPALPEAPDAAQQQAAIEAALELAYADKPARDNVVDFAKQTLSEATAFVRARDLVTVPDAPVKIILMPEFQRGVAIAYADSPGPLDKGLDTYYALSPIPDDWTATQVDSFLREYNKKMMHVLTIHEAMPGHYLEGAHSVKHPSILRAVLRSGLFAEGWAVYTERTMADAGYLDFDPLFRLMQLKFYSRTVANSILDQGVHVDGWSEQQAMDLMVKGTFQQEREAAGKWTRVRLTSAQLPTYFVGAQEHFDLRRAVEAKEGAGFEAKRYHDAVLSHGAPPVRFARQLMLDEPIR